MAERTLRALRRLRRREAEQQTAPFDWEALFAAWERWQAGRGATEPEQGDELWARLEEAYVAGNVAAGQALLVEIRGLLDS
jgi:hypothetical protein